MRINDKQFLPTDKSDKANDTKKSSESKRTSDNSKTNAATGTQKADSVALSSRSRDIAEIAQQLKDSSEVREDRVSELRARIQDGTYHVSGKAIAGSIMDKANNNIF